MISTRKKEEENKIVRFDFIGGQNPYKEIIYQSPTCGHEKSEEEDSADTSAAKDKQEVAKSKTVGEVVAFFERKSVTTHP